MSRLRLVIFDVDGTLVDSQADIVASMGATFAAVGAEAPTRETVLAVVGLSLARAMAELLPEADAATHDTMVTAYKNSYMTLRAQAGSETSSPLYPGARAVLDQLQAQDHTLLGVATGKSRRGLDALIAGHALDGVFVTQQTADHHPSKPHPSMIDAAMEEMGVGPADTVMIGDTSFDMEMARAAGVAALGVAWGYHPVARLGAAHQVVARMEDLPRAIETVWSVMT